MMTTSLLRILWTQLAPEILWLFDLNFDSLFKEEIM